jgi:hypothetical protein
MEILKKITDFIYNTGKVKRKYLTDYPDERILAADASKGIITKGNEEVQRNSAWITSQRAVLLLTNKRIKCGKWNIPLDNINAAQLAKIQTTFGPGQVLKIETKDQVNYQFGMQMNREWTEQTVLPLTLVNEKLKFSLFSLVIRLLLLGYLIYWIIARILT